MCIYINICISEQQFFIDTRFIERLKTYSLFLFLWKEHIVIFEKHLFSILVGIFSSLLYLTNIEKDAFRRLERVLFKETKMKCLQTFNEACTNI